MNGITTIIVNIKFSLDGNQEKVFEQVADYDETINIKDKLHKDR